jgi:PiT family inorganic phosphate transporter
MAFLYLVIGLILIFDFINGFHDSANSIATVVSTKVLSPLAAVGLAATFNFVAFLVFPLKVATTIGKGVINPEIISLHLIGSAVVAAIIWNLITWWMGLPSSSSHTLVGGLVGAAVVSHGFGSVIVAGVMKIVIFIVVAPLLGMIMSYTISIIVMHVVKRQSPSTIDRWFRRLQLISASAFSLGHGGNDAQKSMGIIWVALIATNHVAKNAPMDCSVVPCCNCTWNIIWWMAHRQDYGTENNEAQAF